MAGKMFPLIGATVFAGVVVSATAIEMTRKDPEPSLFQSAPRPEQVAPGQVGVAPARLALERCRDMGEAATRDPDCVKLWAENRMRFLGHTGEGR